MLSNHQPSRRSLKIIMIFIPYEISRHESNGCSLLEPATRNAILGYGLMGSSCSDRMCLIHSVLLTIDPQEVVQARDMYGAF